MANIEHNSEVLKDRIMLEIEFPKALPDGSFCVMTIFEVVTEDPLELSTKIQAWFARWRDKNHTWVRRWSNGQVESLLLTDEFRSIPSSISCSECLLEIDFEGVSYKSKTWKDWLILRVIPELSQAFHEIQNLKSITNCRIRETESGVVN